MIWLMHLLFPINMLQHALALHFCRTLNVSSYERPSSLGPSQSSIQLCLEAFSCSGTISSKAIKYRVCFPKGPGYFQIENVGTDARGSSSVVIRSDYRETLVHKKVYRRHDRIPQQVGPATKILLSVAHRQLTRSQLSLLSVTEVISRNIRDVRFPEWKTS